jgi:hypothetical protein
MGAFRGQADEPIRRRLGGVRLNGRVNRKSPVIDHLRVLNYGRLAISRVVPSVASIKRALYVEAGGTLRQVCPTEGLITMRDHNDCVIP